MSVRTSIRVSTRTSIRVLLALTVTVTAHAQDNSKIVLRRAESFNVINENTREVIGNVEFQQGNVVVTCDKAVQFLSANRVEMNGNVQVVQDTVTLTAPHGIYDGNTKVAYGDGGVTLYNGHMTIKADSGRYLADEKKAFFSRNMMVVDSASVLLARRGVYDQKQKKAVCTGNVKIRSRSDNTLVYGDSLERYDDTRYTRIASSPRLVRFDTADGNIDTLIIVSRLMESYEDTVKRFVATDSVRMTHGEIAAVAGKGIYYSGRDRIVLDSSPIVWYEENQLTGDTITLAMKNRRLDRVIARVNSFAVSRSDSASTTRFNQLSGRDLTMEFEEGRIRRIIVETMATSLYYLFEDGMPNGVNKASGDMITLLFAGGQMQAINVRGGVQGNYYPEKMVRGKENDYNLGGFRWVTSRPSFRYIGESIIQVNHE